MKKIKVKHITVVILAVVLVVSLSGFRLKNPDSAKETSLGDRLIGAVITTESLNTFDMEAYLNDNVGEIIKDKNHTADTEGKQDYNDKIYGRLETVETKNEDGETVSHKEYVFDDIDGFWIFDAKIPATETEESYTCLCVDGGVSNISSAIHNNDGELTELSLTADIYYSYEKWGTVFYMNPVYQESDGDVYVVEGMGHSVVGDKVSGGSGSQTISDSIETSENGEETTFKSTVKINYIPVYVPTEVSFIFMNDDNEALSELGFTPDEVPDEIKAPEGAEYVLVQQKNEEGSELEAVGRGEEIAEYLAEEEDGICSLRTVTIDW